MDTTQLLDEFDDQRAPHELGLDIRAHDEFGRVFSVQAVTRNDDSRGAYLVLEIEEERA